MKAYGYVRVSKLDMEALDTKEKRGISIAAQIDKIESYCNLKELDLVETFTDEGISGKNLNRPMFKLMLDAISQYEVKHIVIWKLDRLFRSTKDALSMMEHFDDKGISLHSIEESLDTKSAMGRFVFRLLASLAELEREITGERMETMAAYKKSKGEHWGRRGRGFDVVDKKRVPSDLMHDIVNAYKLGIPLRQISESFNLPKSTVHNMIKSYEEGSNG